MELVRRARPELAVLADRNRERWAIPFGAVLAGDSKSFAALESIADSRDPAARGDYYKRLLDYIVQGLTDPGDGSYAEFLREAHRNAGVSPEVVGMRTMWLATILAKVARETGFVGLLPSLAEAVPVLAADFGGDPGLAVIQSRKFADHFRGRSITPEMRSAFWDIVLWPAIVEITGTRARGKIFVQASRYLPITFANRFRSVRKGKK